MTQTLERAAPQDAAPIRAAVYLRQSLDRTGEGLAVSRQREDCLRLCAERGWIPTEYVDNDTSASKGVRPQYRKMLADIMAGDIDAVVVWHLDRLHRQPMELEEFIKVTEEADIARNLATVTGEVDLSTDDGRFMARIMGAVARKEIERKKARQQRQSLQRAQSGRGRGPRAFGYNGDHADPELVAEEADAVERAYRDVLAGDSVYSVAVRWNKAGFRTNKGNEWDTTQVKRLLINPRYAGLRSFRREILYKEGEPVRGDWPAIVDMDSWQAVHYLLTNTGQHTAGRPARKYLLGSILVCGECGKPLSSGYTKNAQKASCDEDRPIYKCKNYSCSKVVRRQRLVDPWVQNTILNRIREKGWKLVSDVDPNRVEALHAEATMSRTRIASLGLEFARGNLNATQVKVATDELEARLREVEAQLARLAKSEVFEGLIGTPDLKKRWEGLGLNRKRAVIKALVDKIEVFPVGVKGRAANKLPMGHNIKVHWRKPE
jgi:DNA invertase Pin-like site-specific DNA recombinase